jgi:hypothetical protein
VFRSIRKLPPGHADAARRALTFGRSGVPTIRTSSPSEDEAVDALDASCAYRSGDAGRRCALGAFVTAASIRTVSDDDGPDRGPSTFNIGSAMSRSLSTARPRA